MSAGGKFALSVNCEAHVKARERDAKPERRSWCCCLRPTWCGAICSCCSLIFCLGFFGLATVAALMYRRLTPVYQDVDCTMRMPVLQQVGFEGGFSADFVYGVDCYNPNPYNVIVSSSTASNVYLGKKMTKVGVVNNITQTILPAKGTGTVSTFVDMDPSAQSFEAMFGMQFSAETQLYMEASVQIVVDVDFLVKKLTVAKNFTKECGFRMQVFRSALAKVGPMACEDTMEVLVLPEIGDQAFVGKLGLDSKHVAKKEVMQAGRAKDIGLGVAFIFGVLWGLILCTFGCCGCFKFCCRRKGPEDRRGSDSPRGSSPRGASPRGASPHGASTHRSPKSSRSPGRSPRAHHESEDSFEDSIDTVEALERKARYQAKQLQELRGQLAEGDMRRDLAEQEYKLKVMRANLAKRKGEEIRINVE